MKLVKLDKANGQCVHVNPDTVVAVMYNGNNQTIIVTTAQGNQGPYLLAVEMGEEQVIAALAT